MARYLPDYPIGNGKFENLNPTPIVSNLKPASAPQLSIREQIRVEMELSQRDVMDDDDEDDFDMIDDYEMDFPDYPQPEVDDDEPVNPDPKSEPSSNPEPATPENPNNE